MNTNEQQFAEETLIIAGRLLSEQFGRQVCLSDPQNNSRSNRARVYRCSVVDGSADVPIPTCWCVYRLPAHLALRMENVYRAELVKGCREAADDTMFYRAVTEACAFWMIDAFHKLPMKTLIEQDYKGAASTARERIIMRAELLVQTIEQFGHLEAVGVTMQVILDKLRVMWPEATEIALYPAFRM